MFDVFGNIKALLKIQTVCVDNNIFRLHYQVTVVFLILFSIIVNSRQYFGDPIDCTTEGEADRITRIIDNYCWMHLYKRVGDADKVEKFPGAHVISQSDVRPLFYYQWVGFALFFQAILFFIPRYLWKYCWEGGKIKALSSGMKGPCIDIDNEIRKKKFILDYMERNIGNHNLYFFRYVFCEILNLINVIVQMKLMDLFLGNEFSTYGSRVFGLLNTALEDRDDPMNDIFPKVAQCKFERFGDTGQKVPHESLCILPVNIFSEKIYAYLWFWFIILTTLTSLGLAYRVLTFLPDARAYILHRKTASIDLSVTKGITRHLAVGDWFLLYQVGKNIDPLLFGELLKELGGRLLNYKFEDDLEKLAP